MHTGLFCLFPSYIMSSGLISVIYLTIYIYFRVTSLIKSQSYESQVASEATLRNTDEIYLYQTATNHSKARTVCHIFPLQCRHNGLDGVSNHQPHHCSLNRLFWRRSKKTSKLRVTGLCAGIHRGPVNSPHKWPVKQKMFPFDDVITSECILQNECVLKIIILYMSCCCIFLLRFRLT